MEGVQLQVGVKALLRNPQGQYLLIHRSADKYPEVPNPWEIPGGRIDPGTPLLHNLEREVEEETGLKISAPPRLVDAQDILRIEGRHVVRLTYIADTDGEPILSDEHDEFQWISFDDILGVKGLDIYVKATVEKLVKEAVHERT
jgi:8-oxo-dGTP diphosphatase